MSITTLVDKALSQYEAYQLETGDGFLGNSVDPKMPWYNIELPLAICAEE